MGDATSRVGFLLVGDPTAEQRAAVDWARDRYAVEELAAETVTSSDLDALDAVWWHRDAEVEDGTVATVAPALERYVRDGGGLLLTLRAMASVEALGIDPVAPDAVGVDELAVPTGALWKGVHADHPAVADREGLRIPLAAEGAAPYARYESVLPQEGEVLASKVAGDRDVPGQVSVVSWQPGEGAVFGAGLPLLFDGRTGDGAGTVEEIDADGDLTANRDTLVAGFLDAFGDDPDPRYARPASAADMRNRRERLRSDDGRPRYHVAPPADWLNDPNGLLRWNGRYHVFYQYNPGGPYHATIHWGHAVSDDLVRWEDRPVALEPSPDGPDRDGVWSGCAVVDGGTPTLVYTGGRGREQLPCLATSDDPALDEWDKYDGNPVIEDVPEDLDVLETDHWEAEFRDHSVWREDGRWYQLIGTGITGVGGAALLYTSSDLRDWSYEGPLLVGDWDGTGPVWECPELLDLGDRRLLHVSNYEDVLYFVGSFEDGAFEPTARGKLDHGDFYAPQSMRDGDRYLTWGWLPEARDESAQWDAGWSGALSLPRVLELDGDRLRQRPAPELRDLREARDLEDESFALDDGERRALDTGGRTLELALEIALDDSDAAVLSVFESPDREEVTEVRYTSDSRVVVDRSRSSRDGRATTSPQSMAATPVDEPLSLRAFLDGSVVELFANGRHCLTSRVYPTRADSTGVSLAAEGGRVRVSGLSAWQLGSAWPGQGEVPDR
ncbi:MAG: glycoside hydrolase family 32 protein [Haloarculaceae archaeon]